MPHRPNKALLALALTLVLSCRSSGHWAPAAGTTSWPEYGGPLAIDETGHFTMALHYSTAAEITKANIAHLSQVAEYAWKQETPAAFLTREHATSVTPAHAVIDGEDFLYGCSAFNQVFKLRGRSDANGKVLDELATFDPELPQATEGENYKCRGVTYWHDPRKATGAACEHKIYSAMMDGRLYALDARTLTPCRDFGDGGLVDLKDGVGVGSAPQAVEYYVATAPLVYPLGGSDQPAAMLITGGGVRDSFNLKVASGAVRGYDASTGRRLWVWDPIDGSEALFTQGTPNAWTALAMDPLLGHVYLPTGNATPDYFAAARAPGADHYATSVVALDMRSLDFTKKDARPRVAWHKKLVDRDVWDFDIPAQPILTTLKGVPAFIQATKMGFVFFIDRTTGEWLEGYEPTLTDVTARSHRGGDPSAPSIAAPGEDLAPRQLFPPAAWRLHPDGASIDEVTWDHPSCQAQKSELYYNGIFTPATADKAMRGSLHYPGAGGGFEWGGMSFDPVRRLLYVNQSHWSFFAKLLARADYETAAVDERGKGKSGYRPMTGAPYGTYRSLFIVKGNERIKTLMYCTKPPWGSLIAVDVDTGTVHWGRNPDGTLAPFGNFRRHASLMSNVPEGSLFDTDPFLAKLFADPAFETGTANIGGSLVTSAGILFIGATGDGLFRTIDADTGKVLKEFELPDGLSAMANPMTYVAGDGRQYVVVAAGGNPYVPGKRGKKLVAFALDATHTSE